MEREPIIINYCGGIGDGLFDGLIVQRAIFVSSFFSANVLRSYTIIALHNL